MSGNGGSLDSTAVEILNFNGQAANVELLDRTIDAFYTAATNDQVRFWMHYYSIIMFNG
jgi:hypothetical protein